MVCGGRNQQGQPGRGATVCPLGPFAPGRLAAFDQSVAGVRDGSNSRDARVADGIFMAYPVGC